MRAGPLSSSRVVDTLNHNFVCVYLANEDYADTHDRAATEERGELERIWQEASAKHLSVGTVHAYVLTPDGHPVDSMIASTAIEPGKTLAMLERAVERFKPKPGDPVVPPAPQSSPPRASADSIVLHLVSRFNDRSNWAEIPAEDWIVLRREQWSKLLPPSAVAQGQTWQLDHDVSSSILTYFYPQTENNEADVGRIDKLSLTAKVLTVDNGLVTARIDGFVEMHHVFMPGRTNSQPLQADVVGVLTFQPSGPPSLELITTQADYGGRWFSVAVQTVPHATL